MLLPTNINLWEISPGTSLLWKTSGGPSRVCGCSPMVARWDSQTWPCACLLAPDTRGFHEVELDFNFLKIEHTFPRPWIPGQQFGNPFWDWPQNTNFAFIFVFGYGIAAAEEHGLKDSLQHGRWFYLIAGCIFSGIKSWTIKLEELLKDGPYHWAYVHIAKGTIR